MSEGGSNACEMVTQRLGQSGHSMNNYRVNK